MITRDMNRFVLILVLLSIVFSFGIFELFLVLGNRVGKSNLATTLPSGLSSEVIELLKKNRALNVIDFKVLRSDDFSSSTYNGETVSIHKWVCIGIAGGNLYRFSIFVDSPEGDELKVGTNWRIDNAKPNVEVIKNHGVLASSRTKFTKAEQAEIESLELIRSSMDPIDVVVPSGEVVEP